MPPWNKPPETAAAPSSPVKLHIPAPAPTCGECAHAAPNAQDITQIICFGAPPQLALVPGPGGLATVCLRPTLPRGEHGCAVFAPKREGLN